MKICLGPGPCGPSLSCRASLFTVCLSSTHLESIQPTDRRGERKMGPRSIANNGNTASCFPREGLRGGIRMNLVSNNWHSKLGKEYIKTVYCHPTYLTYVQSTSCKIMLGWLNHKLESRLSGDISIISDMQMTPPSWQKAKRTLKLKEWSEKAGLKLNIQKMKILASSPVTSWHR